MSAAAAAEVPRAGPLRPSRVAQFIVVKRNLPRVGRSYGHWWLELDGTESYGWWPARSPLTARDLLFGGPGALNGGGAAPGHGPPRDPNHGLVADYEFHPVLVLECSDDQVRNAIRRFASTFRGEWRWSIRPTMNCRLFQLALFDAAGLVDGTGNYHTRGSGCPAMAVLRRFGSTLYSRRYWPANLPRPGQRVADVLPPNEQLVRRAHGGLVR